MEKAYLLPMLVREGKMGRKKGEMAAIGRYF